MPPAEPLDFTEFVHATGDRMMRTAYLLCGEQHAAEDLVQSTYATAYAKWRLVRRADHPTAYLLTMLTRTYLSQRRRRQSTEVVVEDVGDRPTESDPSTRAALMEGLGRLSPADRAVLVLRHWEDRSVAETAALLGITESACKTRNSRALERLRAALTESKDLT